MLCSNAVVVVIASLLPLAAMAHVITGQEQDVDYCEGISINDVRTGTIMPRLINTIYNATDKLGE